MTLSTTSQNFNCHYTQLNLLLLPAGSSDSCSPPGSTPPSALAHQLLLNHSRSLSSSLTWTFCTHGSNPLLSPSSCTPLQSVRPLIALPEPTCTLSPALHRFVQTSTLSQSLRPLSALGLLNWPSGEPLYQPAGHSIRNIACTLLAPCPIATDCSFVGHPLATYVHPIPQIITY